MAKRIFLNNIDSFSSKWIAQFLASCIAGDSLRNEEEEKQSREGQDERFKIVGTVANKDTTLSFALKQFWCLDREELLRHLMECDVIVYNITEDPDSIDEAKWAITALHSELEHFESQKMFILLSTIMTWALTEPADPDDAEIPLTEHDYKKRSPHANFEEHMSTETLVLNLGNTNKSMLATYVVASGLQYGLGESVFHFYFKAAWLAELPAIPILVQGTNVIPTIHIHDLSRVVQNIIDHTPKTQYFIAVDESKNTSEEIVLAIASALGSGKVCNTINQATIDITETELQYLGINLCMESVFLKDDLNINWDFETGMVVNIFRLVEEYKQTRKLWPIKICLLGPPAVGKSSVAVKLCRYYKLHHVNIPIAISEKIRLLEELLKENEKTNENEGMLTGIQDQLNTLKVMLQNEKHVDEQMVLDIIREKLNSAACSNQGFVLEGFPITYFQAKNLFYDENLETEDFTFTDPQNSKALIPDFIFALDGTDKFLKERVQGLPQSVAEEMHYTQDEFTDNLTKFRETQTGEDTVFDYFDELEILPEQIDCENEALYDKIIKSVGKPMNYGLSPEEMDEEKKRKEDELCQQIKQMEAEKELKDKVESEKMAALLDEWEKNINAVKMQQEELLEAQSIPLRHYLMKHVMPTVLRGLLDCSKVKPDDPVDFLAEYLFRNNTND